MGGGWPWRLAITPPGLPRLAHRARADASRCAALRAPCAALAAPGLHGGVVRQPSHGRHSPGPRLPDPHRRGALARCRRPASAGAVPRSRGAHQRPAALRAPGRGPDPGLESAAGARAPGQGARALRLLPGGVPAGFSPYPRAGLDQGGTGQVIRPVLEAPRGAVLLRPPSCCASCRCRLSSG